MRRAKQNKQTNKKSKTKLTLGEGRGPNTAATTLHLSDSTYADPSAREDTPTVTNSDRNWREKKKKKKKKKKNT
jgi:hypothetical protein